MLIIVQKVRRGEEITYWYGSTITPVRQQNRTNISTQKLQLWAAEKCEELGLSTKWKATLEKTMPHINLWRKKLSWQMKKVQQNLYLRRRGYISTNKRPTSKRIPRRGCESTKTKVMTFNNSRSPSAEPTWKVQGQFTGSNDRHRKWNKITNRSDTLSYGEEEKVPATNLNVGTIPTSDYEDTKKRNFGNRGSHPEMDSIAFDQLPGVEPIGYEPIEHLHFSNKPAFVRHCIKEMVDTFMTILGLNQANHNVGDIIAAFVADPMVKPQNELKNSRTEKEMRPEGETPSRGEHE
jgi:hypothetical protein